MIGRSARLGAGGSLAIDDRYIERRDAGDLPYTTFVKEFLVPNRPVIVSNAASHWRALQMWTPDYAEVRKG